MYNQGWDDPYIPRTHEGLLKWKYAELNSVDFLFEVVLSTYYISCWIMSLAPITKWSLIVCCWCSQLISSCVDRLITIVSCFFCMNVEKRNSWKGTGLHLKVSKTLLLYLANSFSSGVRISTKYLLYERIC